MEPKITYRINAGIRYIYKEGYGLVGQERWPPPDEEKLETKAPAKKSKGKKKSKSKAKKGEKSKADKARTGVQGSN